jgi:hypothetical protein
MCERRATVQALEHLLREAYSHAPAGGMVEISGRRQGGSRSIAIRVADAVSLGAEPGRLRVILARLLLETQNASLTCTMDGGGAWSAVIAFGAKA